MALSFILSHGFYPFKLGRSQELTFCFSITPITILYVHVPIFMLGKFGSALLFLQQNLEKTKVCCNVT